MQQRTLALTTSEKFDALQIKPSWNISFHMQKILEYMHVIVDFQFSTSVIVINNIFVYKLQNDTENYLYFVRILASSQY